MVLEASLLNHTFAGPLSVVGNSLHIISFGTPCKCKQVLNNSKWSSGSHDPLYISTYGILNLARRGKEVNCTMKGEFVHWPNSSKLVDTCPLMPFFVMSIFSFIICMSWAMHIVLISNSNGRLVSFGLSHCWGCFFLPGPFSPVSASSRDDYLSTRCCPICHIF